MRRLILMRHAKSSWAQAGQLDHDRSLNGRGRRGAASVGAWLAERGDLPDLALISTARRTQETWAGLGPAFAAVRVEARGELYHATPEQMLGALRDAPDVERLLMLGHQPGVGATAARLLAAPPADPAFARYPTAATTAIDFGAADWRGVDWGLGELVAFVTPAALQ